MSRQFSRHAQPGRETIKRLANQLYRDECGIVITAEIIIITTVGLLSLIAGWNAVSNALAFELGDVANAVASLDQSFTYRGLNAGAHASCSGGGFADSPQTFTVQPVDVQVTGPGDDETIIIVIPEISNPVGPQARSQAVEGDVPVAVFGVERIEQVTAEGIAVGAATGEASGDPAADSADSQE